jgi:hypothetical protein
MHRPVSVDLSRRRWFLQADETSCDIDERDLGPGEANLPSGHLDLGAPKVALEDLRVAAVERFSYVLGVSFGNRNSSRRR